MQKHWADKKAEEVIRRMEEKGEPIVISTGITPSGIIHLGNLNDPVRGSMVKEAIESRGEEVKDFHWISDDRDPVKSIPKKFMDLEFEIVEVEKDKRKELEEHLAKPYSRIPDPLGCCESWSKHFQKLLEKDFEVLGMNPNIYSADEDLYGSGRMNDSILTALKNAAEIRDILKKYRTNSLPEDWTIVDAICDSCGKLTHIQDWDEDHLYYTCGKKTVKDRTVEGCGEEGKVPISEGKLTWRVDWPARWKALGVTFEPFGKEHAASGGSYDTGSEISRKVFDREPPIPLVYEWFSLNGKPFSSSKGHLIARKELTDMIGPEALEYFFTKRPDKQRDIKLSHIFKMTDQFDLAESVYFDEKEVGSERRMKNMKRNYELAVEQIPQDKPVRVPYRICATVAQLSKDEEKALQMLRSMEQLPEDLSETEREKVLQRVNRAENWIELYAPSEFVIQVQEKLTEETKERFSTDQREALHALREELGKRDWEASELQDRIYKMKEEFDLSPKKLFQAIYLAVLGQKSGPRAGQLIKAVGQEKVTEILEEI